MKFTRIDLHRLQPDPGALPARGVSACKDVFEAPVYELELAEPFVRVTHVATGTALLYPLSEVASAVELVEAATVGASYTDAAEARDKRKGGRR